MRTFYKGGVHPSDHKLSRSAAVEALPLPEEVHVPLSQHLGEAAIAKVAKGDTVKTGQLIAEAACFISANVHAPVSGTVTAVGMQTGAQGIPQPMISIRREGDEWAEGIDRTPALVRECALTGAEILEKIKQAGIVGLGGAAFPTHAKLTIPADKKIDHLLINGVECEPYLTSDHRVMLERGEELLVGVSLLMRVLGVSQASIGVENNKPDAVAHLRELAAAYEGIRVVPLKVKYPQGGEKQLIAAVTGRETPPPPCFPLDVGVVVCNVSTALAVYEAVQKNKPLFERVVTVTGRRILHPKNLLVRLGTPVSTLLEAAGGLPEGETKVLMGGPMMGRAMSHLDAPVVKGCSGLTVLDGREAWRRPESECLRCGKCVQVCPMGLEPTLLMKLSRGKLWERLRGEWVINCIECGCCQFTCPASIPLLDFIRLGKHHVRLLGLRRK